MIREQTQRTAGTGPNRAEEIYEKCLKRDPLTAEEAYWLYEQAPLQELALTADRVRRAVVPDLEVVTWQIDRSSRHSRASIRRYACTPSERPKWRTSPASAASPRSTP